MRQFRLLPKMVALLLISLSVGCGGRDSITTNAQAVPTLTPDQAAFFDAVESLSFKLNGNLGQQAALSEALLNGNQAALTKCMKAGGFEYVGPRLSVAPTAPFYQGGWEARPDVDFATQWGFGIFTHDYVPPKIVVNPAYEVLSEDAKASYDAELDRCLDSPEANSGYGYGGQELWSGLKNQFYLASIKDEFAGSRRGYSLCMAVAGYKLDDPNELVPLALDVAIVNTHMRDYADGSPEQLRAKAEGIANQQMLAAADAQCRSIQAEAIVTQLSPVLDNWLGLHQREVDAVALKWSALG